MMRSITIHLPHMIGDTVYLRTDKEQLPRLVSYIKIHPSNLIVYALSSGITESLHYDFEITETKDVLATLEN